MAANMSGFGAAAYGKPQPAADDRYANESFRTLLATHRLRRLDGTLAAGFTVVSESGSTYRVTLDDVIVGDGHLRSRWACNCKARGRCRHIDACEQVVAAEASAAGDSETIEAMGRVEN